MCISGPKVVTLVAQYQCQSTYHKAHFRQTYFIFNYCVIHVGSLCVVPNSFDKCFIFMFETDAVIQTPVYLRPG